MFIRYFIMPQRINHSFPKLFDNFCEIIVCINITSRMCLVLQTHTDKSFLNHVKSNRIVINPKSINTIQIWFNKIQKIDAQRLWWLTLCLFSSNKILILITFSSLNCTEPTFNRCHINQKKYNYCPKKVWFNINYNWYPKKFDITISAITIQKKV